MVYQNTKNQKKLLWNTSFLGSWPTKEHPECNHDSPKNTVILREY